MPRPFRTLATTAAFAIAGLCSQAHAADIGLQHVTLTDIHLTYPDFELGDINVLSDDGHIARLDFAGFANALFVESAPGFVGLFNTLEMWATPAQGYAVKTIRFSGVLDVTQIGEREDESRHYRFLLERPTMTGSSSWTAEDGLTEDLTVHLDDPRYQTDGALPFDLRLNAGVLIAQFGAPGYSSVGFRSITLDIETVRIVTQVPEPATWTMLMLGLAGVGLMARRRSR